MYEDNENMYIGENSEGIPDIETVKDLDLEIDKEENEKLLKKRGRKKKLKFENTIKNVNIKKNENIIDNADKISYKVNQKDINKDVIKDIINTLNKDISNYEMPKNPDTKMMFEIYMKDKDNYKKELSKIGYPTAVIIERNNSIIIKWNNRERIINLI